MGNALDVNVGKWALWGGLEAPERPSNLNITTGLTQTLIGPGEVVGVAGSYEINDLFTAKLGVGNGDWGNADGVAVGSGFGADSYIVSAAVDFENKSKNLQMSEMFFYNPTGGAGALQNATPAGAAVQVANNGSSFYWNQTLTWSPLCFKEKLLIGSSTVLGFFDDYANSTLGVPSRQYNETFYGAATYAKYQFTKLFSLAGRVDYIQCNDGAKFGTVGSGLTPTDVFGKDSEAWALTTTAGFNLASDLLFRLEYRVDWTHVNDASGAASANGDTTSAHLASAQVVYSF